MVRISKHTFYLGNTLDVLRTLPGESVHCVITSPPYWGLRDYGVPGQIGLEPTPEEYVEKMVEVFREVRRVLRDDGTLWLNLGDSYASAPPGNVRGVSEKSGLHGAATSEKYRETLMAGHGTKRNTVVGGLKPKDLVGIPWRVAFALRDDGWWLRSDIIWSKGNPMPESVTDRPTKAHEYIFLLTKSARYFYDHVAIQEESVTQDLRRPYGSEGAWQLDGRPAEQRHAATDPVRATRKQDAVGKNTYTGFNDRYKPLAMRNKRDVWTVATQPFPGAHFAVMPEALVEPCILAGTSEAGCCPKCGAPWERVVEKVGGIKNDSYATTKTAAVMQGGKSSTTLNAKPPASVTTGWRPTCTCNQPPTPCTVLDPFGGSGTVSYVAQRYGRSSIYIDLNPKYRSIAIGRMRPEQPSLMQPYEIVLKEVVS
jgi:DNA modification methylase